MKHFNEKRPQTSHGGFEARQKSLQNSLRQMSSKIDNKNKENNDILNHFDYKY